MFFHMASISFLLSVCFAVIRLRSLTSLLWNETAIVPKMTAVRTNRPIKAPIAISAFMLSFYLLLCCFRFIQNKFGIGVMFDEISSRHRISRKVLITRQE